jgi:serine/threonine protein kinase
MDSLLSLQIAQYKLLSLLGQGGMARVYLGQDTRLNRYVAIKVIDKPFRDDPEYLKRFELEARAVAQLEHSHIVRLYQFGETDDLIFMAMQYIEGAPLATVLHSYRQDQELMATEDVLRITGQVAQALDYAHSKGVIHRDVKPSNIMLTPEGQAVLTDFGLAMSLDRGTLGEIFGTPQYIAPEQVVSSANATSASDQYALGVVLYEMITGRLPFDDESIMDVAMKHLHDPPPPPRTIRPEIPAAVETVILKALAKEPTDRYPSCVALSQALERAVKGSELPSTLSNMPMPQRITKAVADRPQVHVPVAVAAPAEDVHQPQSMASQAGKPWSRLPRPLFYAAVLSLFLMFCALLALSGFIVARFAQSADQTGSGLAALATRTTTPSPGSEATPTLAARQSETTPDETNGFDSTPVITSTLPAETPTPTATATATATDTPEPTALYELYLAWEDRDSLFLINWGEEAVPLSALRLGNERRGEIPGSAWGVSLLEPGGCVTIWQDDDDDLDAPAVACRQVGPRLSLQGNDPFWRDDFSIRFNDREIGHCDRRPNECYLAAWPGQSRSILIATNRDDSLFLVNQSDAPLPLLPLRLGDGNRSVSGVMWGRSTLGPGQCVTIWKEEGRPQPPNVQCEQVGSPLQIPSRDLVWNNNYTVYYNGRPFAECGRRTNTCAFTIAFE